VQDDSTTFVSKYRRLPKRPIIYLARNMRTGMVYVGQTIRPLYLRIRQHKNDIRGRGAPKFGNAFRKHPADFVFYEIDSVATEEELDDREDYWIGVHQSLHPNGYNLKTGGKQGRGWQPSLETRERMARSQNARNRAIWAAMTQDERQAWDAARLS
jgi:hypothetical protein